MNDEIKLSKSEIIGICEFLKIHHFENSYLLLDYITNLQKENEELKEQKRNVIKYIKKNINYYYDEDLEDSIYQDEVSGNELLNILNGDE